jgi:sialic acid synthase SpsE
MQCVSSYPTPIEHAELGGIAAIAGATGLPTGYSDHTPDVGTGGLAVECGACVLEKHFTYSRAAAGPDHSASLEAAGLAEYSRLSRAARPRQERRVEPRKRVLDIEQDVRSVSRQSMVTTRALRAGETVQREHLTFKRPGTGLMPFRLNEAVGRVLLRDVDADVPLCGEDLRA